MSDSYAYFKRAQSAPVPQVVGASPYSYTNSSGSMQMVNVQGGVVSLIEIDAGLGFTPAIGIAGNYLLFPNQVVRITYIVTPPTVNVITL